MIERNPEALQRERFDLIVIGGGVYGAATALEASRRGLRPLLLEKGDFGGGTSANTLRILHGGLRYLQGLDLVRFRESVAQRRWWVRTFPELVRPLPCLMPLYDRGLHRRSVIGPTLLINDCLSWNRNQGIPNAHHLGRGRILDRQETLRRFPVADPEGLKGAALWHDLDMVSPQRLILEMLHWATALGAGVLNYTKAVSLSVRGGNVEGVRARDLINGRDLEFRGTVVVNAAGPWCRALAREWAVDVPALFHPSIAFNLLLDRSLPGEAAVGVSARLPKRKVYFLRPYGRYTLAGTVHERWYDTGVVPDQISEESISRFLGHLRDALPTFPVTRDEVVRPLIGLLPARRPNSEEAARRPRVVDHRRSGGPAGLISVSGVKFTTAPGVAEDTVNRAFPGTHRHLDAADRKAHRPTVRPWIPPERLGALCSTSPSEARTLVGELVEEEAVTCFADLVVRRLDWGLHHQDLREASRLLQPVMEMIPRNPLMQDTEREGVP